MRYPFFGEYGATVSSRRGRVSVFCSPLQAKKEHERERESTMLSSTPTRKGVWLQRASRAPMALYAVGAIVALMLALLVGALRASPAFAETFTVNSSAHPGSGGCNVTECTLGEAVQAANANGQTDTINFASGLSGEIDLHNSLTQGGFSILNDTQAVDLTINGPGARVLAVNGNNETRPFGIATGVNATIRGLTIKNGLTHSNDPNGGGISNSGTLTLANSTLSGNKTASGGGGGGISNVGTLTITDSTISADNNATYGGGIFNG